MAYPAAGLVHQAVESLGGKPPLVVVTLPALLRAAVRQGVDPTSAGVEFGSTEETELLEDFFRIPRSRFGDRPYRAPWVPNPASRDAWQTRDYGGKTLQRSRKERADRGQVFIQTKGTPRDTWQLLPTAGADLAAEAEDPAQAVVRLADLAIWFGRDRDSADIDDLMGWFEQEFQPHRGDLVGTVFADGVPDEYRRYAWVEEQLDDDDFERLGSLPPAPQVPDTLSEFVAALEERVSAAGFELAEGLVHRVITGWLRGDIVVLVGQPGTGKTFFATALADAMRDELGISEKVVIPITDTSDEADVIGYERLDGGVELRDFSRRVLDTDKPLEPHVVVFEEFNLTSVEAYLASVLVATQEPSRTVRLPGGAPRTLPVDAFLIATCNSFRDEPETRTRLSAPAKRRSTIVTMPNVLWHRVESLPDGLDDPAFEDLIADLLVGRIVAEGSRVTSRASSGQATTFDSLREPLLAGFTARDDVAVEVRQLLAGIVRSILETPEGRSWFTLASLRDVGLEIAFSGTDADAQMTALSRAVASKVVHQVRGSHSNADALADALGPILGEVGDLLTRMKEGGVLDELSPLL